MAHKPTIEVSELRLGSVKQTDVIRCGDDLVVMIDDQPFRLDVRCASSLAWVICTQIDAIRTEQIQAAVERQRPRTDCGTTIGTSA